jgi:LmbE family N-acetylglucosaminyl deacetylase
MKSERAVYDRIYLSPHLDDAVLSCGGRIWQQAENGQRVLVVTVFAAPPKATAPLSPFAQALHRRWGEAHAPARRLREDFEALHRLGAVGRHWPYTDCIYRQGPGGEFLYPDEAALWGPIQSPETDLVRELARRIVDLSASPDARIYAPLGAGRHVDHRIVRQAAQASGRAVRFYEDYPYAEDPQAVKRALGEGAWDPQTVPLSSQAVDAKVEAIACYHSQLSTFWADPQQMARVVRAFSRRVGQGRPAERYWRRVT